MWEGGKLRLNCGMVAKRIFGVIVASYDQDGRLLWQRNPEEFPEELGTAPTIHGDVEPYQGERARIHFQPRWRLLSPAMGNLSLTLMLPR